VEVLRGPQGTLYGRNATAGVINVISAKPNLHEFDGWVKGEVGNYHTKRVSAMVNVPLIEDKLAVRIAGALTDRQGYDYNSVTKNHVNGRDLWSGRVTIAFNPTERIRSNLVWERFNEDDNRSRTGKQLCHRDPGLTEVGGVTTQPHDFDHTLPDGRNFSDIMNPALFSQGCKPGSLYEDAAFGTPNGLALPFVFGMIATSNDCGVLCGPVSPFGFDANGRGHSLIEMMDPYGGMMQSRDLRTIASFRDPHYRAKADLLELNFDADISNDLVFSSQTAYDKDSVYSFQDFNRFNTLPIFTNTSSLFADATLVGNGSHGEPIFVGSGGPSPWASLAPGGVLCDPQLGCSNTLAGFDISQAKATQFTQELRLQSSYDGPLNFSLGTNYTRFTALVDYYVMYNLITAFATMDPFNIGTDPSQCHYGSVESGFGFYLPDPVSSSDPIAGCPYIDPNPVESINGDGHNYFRSKNPYRLKSAAAFGELYWKPTDAVNVTAGLRYTDDRKRFTPVPTQVLLSTSFWGAGTVNRGYPEDPPIDQHWGKVTGRLGVDWKPKLSFTDQTMLYAFYSRGYKGGGANPPSVGFNKKTIAERMGIPPGQGLDFPILQIIPNYLPTFKPEFVNAFEVGAKNTLLGGGMMLNGDVFLYDYKDYQVSKIVDRTAVNENFDAKVWGVELEVLAQPTRNLRVNGNIGYLDTALGSGARSIDIMNRTAGDPRYTVVKPYVLLPSNCIIPTSVMADLLTTYGGSAAQLSRYYCSNPDIILVDPATNAPYEPSNYPEINGGAGIAQNLKGNELPNSPHWTMNLGVQYGFDFLDGWRATVRGDAYWQSQSWARVYNYDPYDKLHGWYNVNLSVWIERPEDDLKIELYAKNLLDKTPITDAFLNSDDTALTTNVFVLDPRLIGLSIKKGF
jgi:iron complex outermembrane receptor protein